MAITMCPGQDTSFWRPGDIFEVECSECGHAVEFFKDDASRRCRNCGRQVANPKLNLGCAQWCEHAEQCLGYDPKKKLAAEGENTSLVDRLIEVLGGRDPSGELRGLAIARMEQARTLMSAEGGDPKVILAAALLSELPLDEAGGVLADQEVSAAAADDVQTILTDRANGGEPASLEARIVADAVALAGEGPADPEALRTPAGKVLAQTKAPKDQTG